jgi:predicted house-cleaning NTP pyrophosphatase (Maf/HAM1 superfamily)
LIIPTENESAPAIHRFVEETEVTFDVIPDQAIEAYVDTGIPMCVAGICLCSANWLILVGFCFGFFFLFLW